jgi:hypothetical protein
MFSMCQDSQAVEITITRPENNAEVGHQELVQGNVSLVTRNNVYVLLHPLACDLWFVQNPPSVINADGTWQTLCYFGMENQGVGEYFELVAIVINSQLNAGQTMKRLPNNVIARSRTVTVRRTR